MKLSMMSYTMTRQPERFDLKEMLQLTRELDLDGIDFVRLCDTDPKELRKMTDDLGIPVVCHTFMADLNHPTPEERRPAVDDARRSLDAAVTLGAPVVMIPTPAKKDMARDAARRNWIAGLREVVPYAADAGVTLTIENFPGAASPFVVADDVLEAIHEVPGLKLTFDNGNAGSGEDPAESFTRCAEHVVHAHFKDWDIVDAETEGFRPMLDGRYYRPALIGEGDIDQRSCLAAMKGAGYNGCINIEYEGNKYPPAEAVRKAVEHLRALDAE